MVSIFVVTFWRWFQNESRVNMGDLSSTALNSQVLRKGKQGDEQKAWSLQKHDSDFTKLTWTPIASLDSSAG